MTRFVSRRHPGSSPPGIVAARAQVMPVGLAFGAVMVVTTAAVLQGVPVLRAFLLLTPLAYLAALAWSFHELTRTPAEVLLQGSLGVVRSVWDVARGRRRTAASLVPVFHPRKGDGALLVGFGDAVYAFRPDDWPDFDDMRAALEAAADRLETEGLTN